MKVSMAGQRIGIINRLASSWNILRSYQQGIFGNVESDINHHYELCNLISSQVKIKINEARILDLACGKMAKQTALFTADDADVTGIDIKIPTYIHNEFKNFL